jgi:hypothetical protein
MPAPMAKGNLLPQGRRGCLGVWLAAAEPFERRAEAHAIGRHSLSTNDGHSELGSATGPNDPQSQDRMRTALLEATDRLVRGQRAQTPTGVYPCGTSIRMSSVSSTEWTRTSSGPNTFTASPVPSSSASFNRAAPPITYR